ncbi:MAG TPA: hypothetical protein VEE84_00360, partial [Burkholderiaceae bacterium]|nr:hypothetical protein [Burkholderiaceae bacterium]
LARALVNRPALLLLDDPLAALDGAGAARVISVIDQFCTAGVTVVVTARVEASGTGAAVAPWPARARTLRLVDGTSAP